MQIKSPQVLSVDEVERLLQGATNLKHRAALAVAYDAGLRASEVVHLKVADIDSDRMILRVEQGKGQRDRYAMLSPSLLEILRTWWRRGHAQGKMLRGGWLFPGGFSFTVDVETVKPPVDIDALPAGVYRLVEYPAP